MYRNEILRGIDFLISVQNSDGGIPGMAMTGTSACWTTAEALETVLLSPYLHMTYHPFVFKMINFLLDTQIKDGNNKGAWPEYISTNNAQTITTGHAMAALRLSKDIIVDDAAFVQNIQNAIDLGFQYLSRVQNTDGGWSIEPDDGNNESRAFSTIFVLRGYIRNGFYCNNTRSVRDACNYLKALRDNKTGGFSKNQGETPDTCYTARIVSVLLQTKACNKKDKLVTSAIKFIFQDKTLKALFRIKHESYVSDNSSGMVIFHSNTPIDVMETLCLCDIYDRRVKRLGMWILHTQEDNGGWYLGGSRDPNINEGVITWTTNEAVYALSCCNKAFSERYVDKLQKRASFFAKGTLVFVAIIIGLILYPINLSDNNTLIVWWSKIPEGIRNFLCVTVLGGTILNTFYNIIYEGLKKIFKGGDAD